MSLIKKILFSKHLNEVVLATILLILRIWVVLNTSAASMTSTDLITSLASMTSTASLASKNQKQPALYILSDFPGIRNLSGLNDLYSLNNLSGLNDLDSLISSKKLLSLMFWSTLAAKWLILVSQCWMDHQKSTFFIDFWQPLYIQVNVLVLFWKCQIRLKDHFKSIWPSQNIWTLVCYFIFKPRSANSLG